MEAVYVERLDHLGLIASVMRDLDLIGTIDARLVPYAQEEFPQVLNGLRFPNRPFSLTPQFFANQLARPVVSGGRPDGDVQSVSARPDAR